MTLRTFRGPLDACRCLSEIGGLAQGPVFPEHTPRGGRGRTLNLFDMAHFLLKSIQKIKML